MLHPWMLKYISHDNCNNFNIHFLQEKPRVSVKKFVKIGRPGYKGMKKPVVGQFIRSDFVWKIWGMFALFVSQLKSS